MLQRYAFQVKDKWRLLHGLSGIKAVRSIRKGGYYGDFTDKWKMLHST